ncbi:uncharacterized protein G2W53_022345 [Senna tora]|uniref:Uncharacterized protein n=1 Tax=Senna tora TaxID=362788 RepID=A0A834TNG9_9FABA|nr:uncharacterized protein G2W53_022345 [Senna tora]
MMDQEIVHEESPAGFDGNDDGPGDQWKCRMMQKATKYAEN